MQDVREIPAIDNEKISDLVLDFMNFFNALKTIKKIHTKKLDKRFLYTYTKTKRPYSLEVLHKMLKDQCEEVNVIGEEKFS